MIEIHRSPPEPFERRVTRTFAPSLQAVQNYIVEPAEFSASFEWSPSFPPPATMPDSIGIDSEAADLVHLAAKKLKKNRIETRQIFSGSIVELRHVAGDAYGEIAISKIRNNRTSKIDVRLRKANITRRFFGMLPTELYSSKGNQGVGPAAD